MVVLRVFFCAALLSAPAAGFAQIYEWVDATGSRHFTNDPEDIPENQRDDARIVVRKPRRVESEVSEIGSRESGPQVVRSRDERGERRIAREDLRLEAERWRFRRERERRRRTEPEPIRQAQVVYDRSNEPVAPVVAAAPVVQDVNVHVSGPLAVSQVVVEQGNFPAYPYGTYYDGPAVSTSFDRGRYRHRTVRMLLQEQFQFDRDGPYFYVPPRVPAGPVFRTQLSRGLRPDRRGVWPGRVVSRPSRVLSVPNRTCSTPARRVARVARPKKTR